MSKKILHSLLREGHKECGCEPLTSIEYGAYRTSIVPKKDYTLHLFEKTGLQLGDPVSEAICRAFDDFNNYMRIDTIPKPTVSLKFAALPGNIIGIASFPIYTVDLTALIAKLNNGKNIFSLLPNPIPVTTVGVDYNVGRLRLTSIQAYVFGFISFSEYLTSVPEIILNDTPSFNYSTFINKSAYDFETIFKHEVMHALGFISNNTFDGMSINKPQDSITLLDTCRFEQANLPSSLGEFQTNRRTIEQSNKKLFLYYPFNGTPISFSVSTGNLDLDSNYIPDNGGDGYGVSHWKAIDFTNGTIIGVMVPVLPIGVYINLTIADIYALHIMGYVLVTAQTQPPHPPPVPSPCPAPCPPDPCVPDPCAPKYPDCEDKIDKLICKLLKKKRLCEPRYCVEERRYCIPVEERRICEVPPRWCEPEPAWPSRYPPCPPRCPPCPPPCPPDPCSCPFKNEVCWGECVCPCHRMGC